MYKEIGHFISSRHECQINNAASQAPAGLLHPFEVPELCWDIVTTDFLTEIPTSESGFDASLVIMDNLSKRAIFAPVKKHTLHKKWHSYSKIIYSLNMEYH